MLNQGEKDRATFGRRQLNLAIIQQQHVGLRRDISVHNPLGRSIEDDMTDVKDDSSRCACRN